MTPQFRQGQLTTWNDDRGFGFITPAEGGQRVFIHITALGRVSRRPEVGDTVTYQLMAQPNGKIRAVKASIQGVAVLPPKASRLGRPKNRPNSLWTAAATLLALTGVVLWELQTGPRTTPPPATTSPPVTTPPPVTTSPPATTPPPATTSPPVTTPPPATTSPTVTTSPTATPPPIIAVQPDCLVKGNISYNSGAKIYHIPGMEDYDNTVIDPARGEKWFCDEAEAIAQGWRKAPR